MFIRLLPSMIFLRVSSLAMSICIWIICSFRLLTSVIFLLFSSSWILSSLFAYSNLLRRSVILEESLPWTRYLLDSGLRNDVYSLSFHLLFVIILRCSFPLSTWISFIPFSSCLLIYKQVRRDAGE